jgi:hypothetical protein
MKGFLIALGLVFGLIVVCLGLTALNFTCGAVSNASSVLKKEVYPEALLRKYEWFKNASAELDKKTADIAIYTAKINDLKDQYKGEKRSAWDRTDKETMNQWDQELAGIKASYNGLSAEYNAQMSKINWAFCNVGQLPPGSTQPLPREYKPYVEQ